MLIKINNKEYDLAKAPPLTLGDWEIMESEGLVSGDQVKLATAKGLIITLHLILIKVDPELTRDHIRQLPMSILSALEPALKEYMEREEAGKAPLASGPST